MFFHHFEALGGPHIQENGEPSYYGGHREQDGQSPNCDPCLIGVHPYPVVPALEQTDGLQIIAGRGL